METAMLTRQVDSVCPYCGVGCGMRLHVEQGQVVRVEGSKTHPSNLGRLCTKGLTSAQVLTAPGRMARALLRPQRQGALQPIEVDEAIERTARGLQAVLEAHGPDAIALYVSGQMSLEAQYLANKLCKGYLGTNQIESNSRLCMASAGSGYKLSLGADGPPGSYEDFDRADLFLVIGSNMADCHPILFLRLLDRVKAGARLIVVDPRQTATADKAHLFMQIKPGTDLALLNGLLYLLHVNGHTDPEFIARFTEGWEVMPDFLAEYTPERVSAITGIPASDIEQAARMIGEAGAWMSCWTMGLNQSSHSTWNTNAVCNLHLATGAICQPGSGPFSLTGQPNAMGGREMGYLGPGLPGQRSVLVEAERHLAEDIWGLPRGTLHTRQSGGTVAMFERMARGEIKACWIICTNPIATVPNRQTVIDGLKRAELVITQDAFVETETNAYADIVLPGALWAEAEGVMVNSERTLTLMQKAVEPPGQALPDWQIIARVACALGFAEAFSYASAAEVFAEIKRFSNPATGYDLRGASYQRLRDTPLQWPCPPDDSQARHPIRYLNDGVSQRLNISADGTQPRIAFATASGKGRFFPRPHVEPAELPNAAFPFVLNTGRLQHQWHTMTKTGKVPTLNRLNPGPFVEIHPADAAALGMEVGDRVEVRSVRGRVELPARLTAQVRAGNCFVPMHWNDLSGEHRAINAVTNDAVDPVSQQPELKFSAVALTRLGPAEARLAEPRTEDAASAMGAGAPDPSVITLLWASQTGNAEAFAQRCAERIERAGRSVRRMAMDACRLADIPPGGDVLLVASTFGDGDPPDNAAVFWRTLQNAPADCLRRVRYAVLAFGDSSYDQFCGFGRALDGRVAELGGERLVPRAECEPDSREVAEGWFAAVCAALGVDVLAGASGSEPAPSTSGRYDKNKPLRTRLLLNRCLNGAGASKETRQFVFDLKDTGLSYEAGDALGVWPRNCPDLVAEILALLNLSPAAPVQIRGLGVLPVHEALSGHLEIARVTPELLAFVAERSGSAVLEDLLKPEHRPVLKQWLWGRQFADLLLAFPVQVEAQAWVDVLKPLQPRLYSISSSPKAQVDEVHLTVSIVRYTHQGKQRHGVCSSFLADRAADAEVPVFVQPSAHFRPPADPETPMIMVGPGTGVAPFRGFLHERRARGDTGRNWLFFGEQHQASDFYYRDELAQMHRDGLLSELSLAFSRDQARKIYVQDRMLKQGARLWAWLQEGAHFYVCGDAARMARDVDAALRAVVRQHGGLGEQAASDYVDALLRNQRYVRDVY